MGNETFIKYNTTQTPPLDMNSTLPSLSITSDSPKKDRYFYIGIYGAIIAGIFIASLLRNFALVFWTMASSSKLHNNLFMSLVRAPMNFFEKNSMGKFCSTIRIVTVTSHRAKPRVIVSVSLNFYSDENLLFHE